MTRLEWDDGECERFYLEKILHLTSGVQYIVVSLTYVKQKFSKLDVRQFIRRTAKFDVSSENLALNDVRFKQRMIQTTFSLEAKIKWWKWSWKLCKFHQISWQYYRPTQTQTTQTSLSSIYKSHQTVTKHQTVTSRFISKSKTIDPKSPPQIQKQTFKILVASNLLFSLIVFQHGNCA
jgi:hypothetical protein